MTVLMIVDVECKNVIITLSDTIILYLVVLCG